MTLEFNVTTRSITVGDSELSFETGRLAKQAGGSVLVTCGETVVLVTATAAKEARVGIDFFPLTCDYVGKSYAAGKIPGKLYLGADWVWAAVRENLCLCLAVQPLTRLRRESAEAHEGIATTLHAAALRHQRLQPWLEASAPDAVPTHA